MRQNALLLGVVVLAILTVACCGAGTAGSTSDKEPPGRTMYVCGYDRCRDSGEYGQLIYSSGINVWNNPDPDRGGVHHKASNGDKVTVVEEKRVSDGPGGLWYRLQGGGWTNDLWLTDQVCTAGNISEYSYTDCFAGKY